MAESRTLWVAIIKRHFSGHIMRKEAFKNIVAAGNASGGKDRGG